MSSEEDSGEADNVNKAKVLFDKGDPSDEEDSEEKEKDFAESSLKLNIKDIENNLQIVSHIIIIILKFLEILIKSFVN